MQILAGVLLFFLSLTIGSLLCWHIYLLCHNMTTIEVSYYSEFQTSHPLHSFVAPYFIVFSTFASVPGGSKSEVACKEERAEISPPVRSWHEEEHSNGTFTLKKNCVPHPKLILTRSGFQFSVLKIYISVTLFLFNTQFD